MLEVPWYRDRRFLIALLVTVFIALPFWLGSRYPALNEKAIMGADTSLSGLGFEILMHLDADASLIKQIIYTGINWLNTNRQGMTFGLLIAPVLMIVFSLLQNRDANRRLSNTVAGVLLGSPLGICVNCATPIAQGIHSAGGRLETALAALFSSPTLNIIVLTMMFSLFPVYVAVIKLGLTLLFILIGLPLLLRFLPEVESKSCDYQPTLSSQQHIPDGALYPESPLALGWLADVKWVFNAYWRNLLFIGRRTIPLMILSGFLGAAIVTFFPFDSFVTFLSAHGKYTSLVLMSGLALIGVILPVPMAFDVIVASILSAAGLPIKYVLVLLFTLGIFSIYPYLVLWRNVSRSLAVSIFISVLALGIVAGVIGHYYERWEEQRQHQQIFEVFAQTQKGPNKANQALLLPVGTSQNTHLLDDIKEDKPVTFQPVMTKSIEPGVSIQAKAFRPQNGNALTHFRSIEGAELGIVVPDQPFSILKMVDPFSYIRGIAAGDFDQDGWTDIALASTSGVLLYHNDGGKRFTYHQVPMPELQYNFVANTALVDMDNDGWLDLFFSTYRDGSYLITNTNGTFTQENTVKLPNVEGAVMVAAPAFGDLDQDGDLDIFLGNWSIGEFLLRHHAPPESSRNAWLETSTDGFKLHELLEFPGETLSSLFTDFNADGYLDLIVGNDFMHDSFYLGDGTGNLVALTREDSSIPHSTRTTMNLSLVDTDNDLIPEIYIGQISFDAAQTKSLSPHDICIAEAPKIDFDQCLEVHTLRAKTIDTIRVKNPFACQTLAPAYQEDCIAFYVLWEGARFKRDERVCDYFSDAWAVFRGICRQSTGLVAPIPDEVKVSNMQFVDNEHNVLLKFADGNFHDDAQKLGIDIGGWTWNAKFADIDNDEWQDLYIVNGIFMYDSRIMSNLFYRNKAGAYSDATQEYGLQSYRDTLSYLYIDIENDGDLDIISVPAVGNVVVYKNELEVGNAIAVSLIDRVGNSHGIGSRIIIRYGDAMERHQVRDILASGGFASFDAPVTQFGLGVYDKVAVIEITWSTGETSILEGDFVAGVHYQVSREKSKLVSQ